MQQQREINELRARVEALEKAVQPNTKYVAVDPDHKATLTLPEKRKGG
jgi:hypothetical protein